MNKILTNVYLFKTSDEIIKYIALWDTGATETLISKKVINELKLNEAGKVEISTINGNQIVKRYYTGLIIEGHSKSINIAPASFTSRTECDVIIGMDIINYGTFLLDKGKFSFTINQVM